MPAGKAEYTVKSVETVVAGTDVRVRLFTLAPGEVIPWHSHTEIADHFFVLAGELTVEMRAPYRRLALGVGERHEIPAGNIHQTSNHAATDCRFLLIQGVGKYDFKGAR